MLRTLGFCILLVGVIGCQGAATTGRAGSERINLEVTDKGFEPAVVTVAAGKPVTLVVTRKTARTCATELVMASHGINRPLPLGEKVEITFTPDKPGELTYACAMDMYRGKIVVK